MKKSLLLLTACTAITAFCNAQGFYLRGNLGYAFPQAGQTLDGTGTPYSGSSTLTVFGPENDDLKKASFGSGTYLGLGGGYMFNEYIGADAAFSLGIAPTKYTLTYINQAQGYNVSSTQQATNPSFFIPSLVLQSGGDKIKAYGRIGVVLPLNTQITQDQVYTTTPATHVTDYTFQIKNSFSLGFAATAGVQYKLSDKVRLTGEFSFLSLSTLIKQSDFTKLTQDGQSYPITADSTVAPHTTYSTHVTGLTASSTNLIAYTQPFSNVGFNLGIMYTFGAPAPKGATKKKKGRGQADGYYHH